MNFEGFSPKGEELFFDFWGIEGVSVVVMLR